MITRGPCESCQESELLGGAQESAFLISCPVNLLQITGFKQSFSTSALDILNLMNPFWGAVLRMVGCLTASLASTH